jgi:hypothetical protein
LRNHNGLILGWKELKATKAWKLTGLWHQQEVAVTLDRHALVDRLKALLSPDQANAPVVWRPADSLRRSRSGQIP